MKKYLILFLVFLTAAAYTQSFSVRHIRTKSDSVIVSALQISDNSDEPVIGLRDSSFSVSIDTAVVHRLSATTYKEAGIPIDVMLCVDISSSMKGKPLATMKNAINKFIDELRNDDRLAIIGFENSATLITDFSSDKSYLRDKVKSLTTSGNQTALFYGTSKGLDGLISKKEQNGKILLLLGDGKDEDPSNSYKEEDVIKKAEDEGIPIFTIGYSKIDKSYLRVLENLSEKTGGRFYNSPNDEDLEKQYKKLFRQITNIYLIRHYSPIKGDEKEHNITIAVKYLNAVRPVTAKFILSGQTKYMAPDNTIKEPIKTDWLLIGGIILAVLIIGGVIFFFYKNSKKKQAEFQRKLQEEQNLAAQKLDEERKKREDAERKIEEANAAKNAPPQPNQGHFPGVKYDPTVMDPGGRNDRTQIIKQDSGSSSDKIVLDFLMGPLSGQKITVASSGVTIGRKQGNSLPISDETLSGQHAQIYFSNGYFFIKNLSQSNGTYLNGSLISSEVPLKKGDVFKFGKSEGTII